MNEPTVWLLLLALALSLLGWWWASRTPGWRLRRHAAQGREAERDAERLLAEEGYEIVDRQVQGEWTLWVDGEALTIRCRADLLVERDEQRFVAEVKGGVVAADPRRPATRRQLLEYHHAFEVDGVLLVDVPGGRLLLIEM